MGGIFSRMRERNQQNAQNQATNPAPANTSQQQPPQSGQSGNANAGATEQKEQPAEQPPPAQDPPAPEEKAADPPAEPQPQPDPQPEPEPEPAPAAPVEEKEQPPQEPATEEPAQPPAEEPQPADPQPDPQPEAPAVEEAPVVDEAPATEVQPEPAAPAEPEPVPEPEPEPEPAPVVEEQPAVVEPAVEAGPQIVERKEIRAMSPAEADRFFNAVNKMMENKDGPGTSEYFRIAGYHGRPGNAYCSHGVEPFPGWHRIYLLEFELGLQAADRALGGDGNIGLPYWDWSQDLTGIPSIVRERFPEFPADLFPNNNSEDWPVINRNSDSQVVSNFRRSRIVRRANDCLLATQHWAHASTANSRRSRYPSLETPHNSVHVACGSPMNSVSFAAFDICFWLHHCNIDRIYSGYLVLEPDSQREFERYQNRRRRDLYDTEFEPFRKPDGSRYAPKDTFATEELGYVYTDLPTVDSMALQEIPTYAIFENIKISDMNGSCYFLHVFAIANAAVDDWKAPEDVDAYEDDPAYAGYEVIFGKGPECEQCRTRPLFDLRVDITDALTRQGVSRYDVSLRVMTVETTDNNTVRPIDATPVPIPVIDGPLFDDREAPLDEAHKETARPEDVRALQSYLEQFGYYGGGVDGDFGPVTDKAVRFYQQLAGLEVDGLVGPITKKQILNATRCGEKDVDTSVTTENVGELEFARPRDQGPFYGGRKEISYSLGVVPGYLDRQGCLDALEEIFAQYGVAAGLTFNLTDDEEKSDIKIGWDDADNKKSVRFDGAGGVLARGGDGFLTLDEAERWTIDPAEAGNLEDRTTWRRGDPVVLFQHVALHELGHALGLGHSNDREDVMAPYYNPGLVVLSDADKARVAAIYAEEEPAAPAEE